MKLRYLAALAASTLLAAAPALALPPDNSPVSEYTNNLVGMDHVLYVTHKGESKQYVDQHNLLQRVTDHTESILRIKQDFANQARAELERQLQGKASLKAFSMTAPGPLTVKLAGNAQGEVVASVGGFSLNGYARVKKSWYAEATISIRSNPIWISARYNPYSGQLSDAQVQNLDIQASVDVDTVFDFIPGFNALFTNKLEDMTLAEIQGAVAEINNARLPTSNMAFSLDKAIPPGAYIVGNTDINQFVREKLTNFVAGQAIAISLHGERVYYYNGRASFEQNTLVVEIPGGSRIAIAERPIFELVRDECYPYQICP